LCSKIKGEFSLNERPIGLQFRLFAPLERNGLLRRPGIPELRQHRVEHAEMADDQLMLNLVFLKYVTVEELSKVPLDIGLMNEDGYPHKGFLNYV
jgi:hypothetical protein